MQNQQQNPLNRMIPQVKTDTDLLKEITEVKILTQYEDGQIRGEVPLDVIVPWEGLLTSRIAKASLNPQEYTSMCWLQNMMLGQGIYEVAKKKDMSREDYKKILAGFGLITCSMSLAKEGPNNVLNKIKLTIVESMSRSMDYISDKRKDAEKLYKAALG